MINGVPIYIATKTVQRRRHHKYRINKKWRKQYGVVEYDMIPRGKVIMFDGKLWMTQKDFDIIVEQIKMC